MPVDTDADEHVWAGMAAAAADLRALQRPDGRWEGEMVWNTTLLSQYVLSRRILDSWPLADRDHEGVLRHYRATQRADGSWPIHCDGPGSVYVTALAYV